MFKDMKELNQLKQDVKDLIDGPFADYKSTLDEVFQVKQLIGDEERKYKRYSHFLHEAQKLAETLSEQQKITIGGVDSIITSYTTNLAIQHLFKGFGDTLYDKLNKVKAVYELLTNACEILEERYGKIAID